MGLKWKKDGTAKCGRILLSLEQIPTGAVVFGAELKDAGAIWWSDEEDFGIYLNADEAKIAAESWLRKQAQQMLKDLEANQ